MSVKAGIVACSVLILATCSYCYYLFYLEDYGISKSYCSVTSPTTSEKLEFMNSSLLIADILITVADCFLRRIIYRQNKRKIDKLQPTDGLPNKRKCFVHKIDFPLALVHSSLFISHLLSLYIGKGCLCCLMLLIL
uniref:Uncharacterized protein n=1 Tax=Ditylenchus dipsaci TaxID=166011 RepID=A0A915ET92_9BILA